MGNIESDQMIATLILAIIAISVFIVFCYAVLYPDITYKRKLKKQHLKDIKFLTEHGFKSDTKYDAIYNPLNLRYRLDYFWELKTNVIFDEGWIYEEIFLYHAEDLNVKPYKIKVSSVCELDGHTLVYPHLCDYFMVFSNDNKIECR